MAAVYTPIVEPRNDGYVSVTKITGAESVAGGVAITPEQLNLQSIDFAFGLLEGSTTEGTEGFKTSTPGIYTGGILRFYNSATGKELVTGKTATGITLYVVAYGRAKAK